MKTHKCFKRLPHLWAHAGFFKYYMCRRKGRSAWNMPQAALFLSFPRTCECRRQGGMAVHGEAEQRGQGPGGWSVLAGKRKRQLWGQTDALLTLCFLVGDLGAEGGSIVPKAEEKC